RNIAAGIAGAARSTRRARSARRASAARRTRAAAGVATIVIRGTEETQPWEQRAISRRAGTRITVVATVARSAKQPIAQAACLARARPAQACQGAETEDT